MAPPYDDAMSGTNKPLSMSADQIRSEGCKTSIDDGHGDYTKKRQEIFADLELDDLIASIRRKEKGSNGGQ